MKAGHPVRSQRSDFGERLRSVREASGLSQRQVAAQLNISQPAYALWELHNVALRPEQLTRLAQILSVRVEELLEQHAKNGRRGGPIGKARRVFETVSQMPRHQQQKILEVVEALIERNANGHTKAA